MTLRLWRRSADSSDPRDQLIRSESARLRKIVDGVAGPLPPAGWRTWVQLAGSIASLVALVASAASLTWFSDQVWPILIVVWLLGFTSYLLWRVVKLRDEFRRRARYAVIVDALHGVQHAIRDAEWYMLHDQVSAAGALSATKDALTHAARAFTVVTTAPCRACIKAVAAPESAASNEDLGKLLVKTLCRDSYTTPSNADEEAYEVTESTAFESLVDNKQRINWWFSNDLLQVKPYKNKSIPPGGEASDLSYRSTAVWPIRKAMDGAGGVDDLRGFLCVDSPVEDIFEERFDFQLGASFADSLYALLRLMIPDGTTPAGIAVDLRGEAPALTPGAELGDDAETDDEGSS